MDRTKLIAIGMLIPFSALTVYALVDVGPAQIFATQLSSSGGLQVWVDLLIAIVLILMWMVPDARRKGRRAWPYVLLALAAGSFGPLLYLALGTRATAGRPPSE